MRRAASSRSAAPSSSWSCSIPGDTTEKAKNAAQRMVAQETDPGGGERRLSQFIHAGGHRGHGAGQSSGLTLSYSDLITDRGFKYVFQTSATAGSQAKQALPQIVKLAETASGKSPRRLRSSPTTPRHRSSSAKAMRDGLLAENGLQLIVDETFTPPLADATSLVQKIRSAKPDLLVLPADRDFRRQAAAREDERVRPRTRQDPDHLVRHRHRRTRHAARPSARNCCRACSPASRAGAPRATRR